LLIEGRSCPGAPTFQHDHQHRLAGGARIGARDGAIIHEHHQKIPVELIADTVKKDFQGRRKAAGVASTSIPTLNSSMQSRSPRPIKEVNDLFRALVLQRWLGPWSDGLLLACNANEGARGNSFVGKARVDRDAVKGQPSAFQTPRPRFRGHRTGQRRKGTRARNVERYTQEGRSEMNVRRYPVVIEQTGTGYSAYSPDVSGCVAVGDTQEETRRNFQDALAEHFMAMREVGEPIPEPHSSVDYVEVAA
jgi:predicted RNase H-like HicB family nuclease